MSIDDKFPRDPRVIKLGRRAGWSRRETMGALIDVFQIVYDRERDVLPDEDIDIAAELDGFAGHMIACDLAERTTFGVRVRGAAERIEYLRNRSEAGRTGGIKSGESRRNRDEAKLRSKRSTASGRAKASRNPPDPVPDDPPDPVPARESPRAPAIPATPERTPAYDHQDPRSRGRLAEATYESASKARIEVAAELGLPEQIPFPVITPANRPRAFVELQDRVREEGENAPAVCDRVIGNLIAQARETRSIEWLSLKSFSSGAWTTARERVPGQRAGPRSLVPSHRKLLSNDTDDEPDLGDFKSA
jgi:hypothetical protein